MAFNQQGVAMPLPIEMDDAAADELLQQHKQQPGDSTTSEVLQQDDAAGSSTNTKDDSRGLAIEIIPHRLYFTSISVHPQSTPKRKYFTVDYDLHYEPYFADFGPLHLGNVVKFCHALHAHMNGLPSDAEIIFYSSHNGHQRANAGCLMACYCVAVLGMSPTQAWALFETAYPPFVPFRDANYGPSSFGLTIFDVISGLHKAIKLGWFNWKTFDLESYTHLASMETGDMAWIVPGKLIGFSGPLEDHPEKNAERLLKPFKDLGVQLIVRLNERQYDKRTFTEVGIRFLDLPFPDGGIPVDSLVTKFIDAAEKAHGPVAVHCRAGLGRTGTMVGLYTMKHYGFSGREFIGWSRLCRPGFVLGQQQQYLEQVERRFGRVASSVPSQPVQVNAAASGHDLKSFPATPTPQFGSSKGTQSRQGNRSTVSGTSSTVVGEGRKLPFKTPLETWKERVEAEEDMYQLHKDPVLAPGKVRPGGGRQKFKYASSTKLDDEKTGAKQKILNAAGSVGPGAGTRQRIAPSRGNGGTPNTSSFNMSNHGMSGTNASVLSTRSTISSAQGQRPSSVGRAPEVLTDLLPSASSHVGKSWGSAMLAQQLGGNGSQSSWGSATNSDELPWGSSNEQLKSGNNSSAGGKPPLPALSSGSTAGSLGSSYNRHSASSQRSASRAGPAGYARNAAVLHSSLTPPSIHRRVIASNGGVSTVQ